MNQAPEIEEPDLPLGELFRLCPATAGVFLRHGMLCFGCPIAPFHTIADACAEYRLDEVLLRRELREAVSQPRR